MRTIFIIAAIIALGIAGCKKSKTPKTITTTIDSLDIHRTGGFIGYSDHYRITPTEARKGRNSNNTIVYDSLMTASKHAEVKRLLTTVPQDMVSNNLEPALAGNDITYQNIVSYKGGIAYTHHIDFEKSNSIFVADLNNALLVLSSK